MLEQVFFQLGNCSDEACSCHLSQTQCLGSLPMSGEDLDLVPERPQAGDWMSRVPSPRLWCHRSPGILGGFGNRNKFLQETLTEYFVGHNVAFGIYPLPGALYRGRSRLGLGRRCLGPAFLLASGCSVVPVGSCIRLSTMSSRNILIASLLISGQTLAAPPFKGSLKLHYFRFCIQNFPSQAS